MDLRSRIVQPLASRYSAEAAASSTANQIELKIASRDFARAASTAIAEQGHLVALYALEQERPGEGLQVRAVLDFEGEDLLLVLSADLDPHKPALESLAALRPWAIGPEREMRDLHGIEFSGHPDPRPLFARIGPGGTGSATGAGRTQWTPTAIDGEGVHLLALGPVGAPFAEAMELRGGALGQRIVHLEPHIGFKHRGAEGGARGTSPATASVRVERICGHCSVAHATAFALAIERMTASEVPRRAAWLRTSLLEMERLAAHTRALHRVLEAAGLDAPAAAVREAREDLLRASELATGSRTLRGMVTPGGMRRDIDDDAARTCSRSIRTLVSKLGQALDAALAIPGFVARLEETGVLQGEVVSELDLAGPAARASGSRRDVRRDHPGLAYGEIGFWVPLYGTGDALARFRLFADEAHQSAAIAEETLDNLPEGPVRVTPGALPPGGHGLGLVEGPRGALLHAVHASSDGRIARIHVQAASFASWPAMGLVFPGGTLEDLPLVRASFDLCTGCSDR